MYVCICNAIRDGALKTLARDGVRCPHRAYETLGHAPRCGACLDTAQRILEESDAQNANYALADDVA